MLKTEIQHNRGCLGFKEAVLNNFKFLEHAGLEPVQQEITCVRYQSDRVFVNVYHGRASFELGVEIGRLPELSKKYDVLTMARAVNLTEEVPAGGAAREPELLKKLVKKLARQTRKYATPFLSGDPVLFQRLERIEQESANEYWHEQDMRITRRKAEQARMAKDYAGMVKAYESLPRSQLTPLEKRRLEYARSHVFTEAGGPPARGGRRRD